MTKTKTETVCMEVSELTGTALDWAYEEANQQPLYIHFDVEPNYETEEDAKRTYIATKLGPYVDVPADLRS